MLNKFYCESNLKTIQRMKENNIHCNVVLTSPPYNTSRKSNIDPYMSRYGEYQDLMTDEEYLQMTVDLFHNLNNVLSSNGVIIYNMSYSTDKPDLIWRTIVEIMNKTTFTIVDKITWKKKNAIPDNRSKNRLTRITEEIFIFARKTEIKTFQCNKELLSTTEKGYKNYKPIYNFIEAPNNDGSTKLNKATYSTKLCKDLLNIYAFPNDVIYDPFMGTGTTALAAIQHNCSIIGSEIDKDQVIYSESRIQDFFNENNTLFD